MTARNECVCDAATPDYEPGQRRCVAHVAAPTPPPSPTPVAPTPSPSGACPNGMALIPAGTFWMGSPEGSGEADEHPQHLVSVGAFCMDRTEVTVNAFASCVSSGTCAPATSSDDDCNANFSGRGNHPINCVDWNQADAYCTSRGGRLPTEEEWEYAARGTDGRIYPWGSDAPGNQLCWNRSNGTCEVGAFPPGNSPFGLFDMAGNVWEWTSSPYRPYSGGSVDRTLRVFRGGGCGLNVPSGVRAANRDGNAVTGRSFNLGFRCVRGVL